jgi:hypothetical protein
MGTKKVKKFSVRRIFCIGLTKADKAGQKSIDWHDELNKPTKEGPLSYVLPSQQGPPLSGLSGLPSVRKGLGRLLGKKTKQARQKFHM